MNDDWEEMRQLLEQATAAPDAPATELDPPTVGLREAWLAFGQLLEAAQPAREIPLDCGMLNHPASAPAARPRRPWVLAAAGALAVSLLIGAVAVWMVRLATVSENVSPAIDIATSKSPAPTPSRVAPGVAAIEAQPWDDDTLDEQLAEVGQQMALARQDQSLGTDSLDLMQYGIEQFRAEMQSDVL